ncbi:hypothetical protein Cob_v000883 [Colletotrichum orbiculare MAFF 240422]|uniref:Uncharacterized protein n=1 Tax=Colletotrichum orbiculare (strain 104-T / ATCC 96160 / CBS 514.97 / LARS 414 / MAFF 240422) TaxID=1213857 RepID=A0A484G8B2_COLOR|nr:hypothetical protein Cob_v000883 [Colletotrichum orbiculare MAFF 240422]
MPWAVKAVKQGFVLQHIEIARRLPFASSSSSKEASADAMQRNERSRTIIQSCRHGNRISGGSFDTH